MVNQRLMLWFNVNPWNSIHAIQCKWLENPHESSSCMICEESLGFSKNPKSFKNGSQITNNC